MSHSIKASSRHTDLVPTVNRQPGDQAPATKLAPPAMSAALPGTLTTIPGSRIGGTSELQLVGAQRDSNSVSSSRRRRRAEQVLTTDALATVELMTESQVAFWVPRINSQLAKSVDAIIAVGKELISAKAHLPHGQFEPLLESGKLHMGKRTAQTLMTIARNQVLANTHNYAFLPPTINSLNSLAKLDEVCLQRVMDEGKINPAMTIAEARLLVSKQKPQRKIRGRAAAKHSDKNCLSPSNHRKTNDSASGVGISVIPAHPPLPADWAEYLKGVNESIREFLLVAPQHIDAVRSSVSLLLSQITELRPGSSQQRLALPLDSEAIDL